jgi:hypothetical protein
MFHRVLSDAVYARPQPDWMLCALVLAIALWGAVLDIQSMEDQQIAAEQPRLEQAALTADGK